MLKKRASSLFCVLIMTAISVPAADSVKTTGRKKLRIFILAGQSNMAGHARISTFGYIGDDPKTLEMLNEMCDKNGRPRVIEDTWISYCQSDESGDPEGEGFGQLTAGYGKRKYPSKPGEKIGPEFTFGIYMQKALKEPILIIKTAWGGKSLFMDFRPPSAGPYEPNETEMEKIRKRGGSLKAEKAKCKEKSGVYYRLMIDHVKHVLKDIRRVYPAYEKQQGYEIAGFIWFQGWNDLVDRGVYPDRGQKGGYDKYSEWMAMFIRDVRKDLKTPCLPFVIGVMGVSGPISNLEKRYQEIHRNFREAMSAPAGLDEFKGNVLAVQTAPFWEIPLDQIKKKRDLNNQRVKKLKDQVEKGELTSGQMSAELKKIEIDALSSREAALLKRGASNAAYHYLGCAKTMALIGKAFAEAAHELLAK